MKRGWILKETEKHFARKYFLKHIFLKKKSVFVNNILKKSISLQRFKKTT